jgi:hypothetical protein
VPVFAVVQSSRTARFRVCASSSVARVDSRSGRSAAFGVIAATRQRSPELTHLRL